MYNYTIVHTDKIGDEYHYSIIFEHRYHICFLVYKSSSENVDSQQINKFIQENIDGINDTLYYKEVNIDYSLLYHSVTSDRIFYNEFNNSILFHENITEN